MVNGTYETCEVRTGALLLAEWIFVSFIRKKKSQASKFSRRHSKKTLSGLLQMQTKCNDKILKKVKLNTNFLKLLGVKKH